MTEEKPKTKPARKYRAGGLTLTVWNNKAKEGDGEYKTFVPKRSYKDKKDEWQETDSLRNTDLPKMAMLLQKAYQDENLTEDKTE